MSTQDVTQTGPIGGRWLQLVIGVVCMAMVANLQYGWALVVVPLRQKDDWRPPSTPVAFTIFVVTETWLVPIEGWFVDKFGPRIVVFVGAILCGIAWAINSVGDSLAVLYIACPLGWAGAG